MDYRNRLAATEGSPKARRDILFEFIENEMVEGEDYAKIPGIPKPVILKSGMEKFASLFDVYGKKEVTARTEMWSTKVSFVEPSWDNASRANKDQEVELSGFVSYEVTVTLYDRLGNVVGTGLGCASNGEKKLRKAAITIANSVLKMAGKRAFSDAVTTYGGLSGILGEGEEVKDEHRKPYEPSQSSSVSSGSGNTTAYKFNFGTCAGKTVEEVKANELDWYKKVALKNIGDGKFVDKNNEAVLAIDAELAKRNG